MGTSQLLRKIDAAFAFGPVTVRLSPRPARLIVSRFARASGEIVCQVSPILVPREMAAAAKLAPGEAVTRAFAAVFGTAETDFEGRLENNHLGPESTLETRISRGFSCPP
jgi:hypothetical protein